jgi:FixJ family two-component response regulator
MSGAGSALLVTADKALASELARLLMARKLSLRVVGTKSSDVDPGGSELLFVDVADEVGMTLVVALAQAHPDCAILAIAPAAQPRLGLDAVRAGAADFVRYPLENEVIERLIVSRPVRASPSATWLLS